jgi:cytochrome c peroxidase
MTPKALKFIVIPACFLGFLACGLRNAEPSSPLPVDEIALGKMLFFDPILSLDNSVSCASCHKPAFAFADTVAFSTGVHGAKTTRNTPSAMNVSGRPYLFWDGRSPSLEDQVLHPIANPVEMGFNIKDMMARLQKNSYYLQAFKAIYKQTPSAALLGQAIAAYERSLETGDSPFDHYMRGDTDAISPAAVRGRELFLGKAACFDCHFSPDFTGDEFRNIGLFNGKNLKDSGRFHVTHNSSDIGKFKVPGLRNVAKTAPYMHNGMFRTLEEVLAFYNDPATFIPDAIGQDPLIKPLQLTEGEIHDLLEFLQTLTSVSLQ